MYMSILLHEYDFSRLRSENLVRAGFQSLQLVIADFLPAIPPSCVPSCVEVGGQYGVQTMDINISLTSIGILVSKME